MSEKRRGSDAARARAPDVNVVASSDLAHRIDRFLQRSNVGLQTEAALGGSRILPADNESLQPAVEAVANDAFFRRQIEHIELVDLRGRNQQRSFVHLFR